MQQYHAKRKLLNVLNLYAVYCSRSLAFLLKFMVKINTQEIGKISKEIGKIQNIKFGAGGYQDAMLGLTLYFGSTKNSWGIVKFYGAWGIAHTSHCKWSHEDRLKQLGEAVMMLGDLLVKTGKKDISELVGTPVEVTFDGHNTLKDWRVLEEVL